MISLLYERVFNDVRDDWILDRFRYLDLLRTDKFLTKKNLIELERQTFEHGTVYPPKNRYLSRQSEVLPLHIRISQTKLIDDQCKELSALESEEVFSYKLNNTENKYIFKHYFEDWELFEKKRDELLLEYKFVASLDIANFYPSIKKEALKRSLNEISFSHNLRKKIIKEIEKVTQTQENGLPQNNDFSSVVANLMLVAVDETLRKESIPFIRYSDDYFIYGFSEAEVISDLNFLRQKLRGYGFVLNSGKTIVKESKNLKKELVSLSKIQLVYPILFMPDFTQSPRQLKKKLLTVLEEINELDKSTDGFEYKRELRIIINKLSYLSTKLEIRFKYSTFKWLLTTVVDRVPNITIDLVKLLLTLNLNSNELKLIQKTAANTPFLYISYLFKYLRVVVGKTDYWEATVYPTVRHEEVPLEQELISVLDIIAEDNNRRKKVLARNIGKLRYWHSRRLLYTFFDRVDEAIVRELSGDNLKSAERIYLESVKYFFNINPTAFDVVGRFAYVDKGSFRSYL